VNLRKDYDLFGSAIDARLFCGVRAKDDVKEELSAGDLFTATDGLVYLFTGIVFFKELLFALVLIETAIGEDYQDAILCNNLSFLGLRNCKIKKTALSRSSPQFATFAAIMRNQSRLLAENFSLFLERRIKADDEQR